jgi:aryl-alcohol dehydrogenase-like predicted oxidoreductase
MGIEGSGTFQLGGHTLHRLGFGAMRLCGPGVWGHPADRDNPARVLERAVELGIDLIDTSDAYGPEVNEYQLEATLHPYDGLVVATKGGLVRSGPGEWIPDGRPAHLRRALSNRLRRLGVARITLYQLHAVDPDVPFAESVGALARAKEEGLIEHVELSDVNAAQLEEARGIVEIATVQNRYNLTHRTSQPVLDACEAHGIGFIPWYPLAAGPLAKPDGAAGRIAAAHGATPSQVALAWLLAKSPVMLPIPGTSSVAHLEENCAAADLTLSAADLAALDAAA